MSAVNITNVTVLDNPTPFLNPFQFEISYECLVSLKDGFEGYSYLYEPLWWTGMITREVANFTAYAFAPAILVTPLGALIIIICAILARIILQETLHTFKVVGCLLSVVGSTTIVLHARPEHENELVIEVWNLSTEPGCVRIIYEAIP